MERDQRADSYFEFLSGQRGAGTGSEFPVFRGTRGVQYGQGFGDVFRGIFRYGLPILAKGAMTFLSEFTKNKSAGDDWKSAAKTAIMPTVVSSLSEVGTQLEKAKQTQKEKQEGSGKRKRHPRKKASGGYKARKSRILSEPEISSSKLTKFNF